MKNLILSAILCLFVMHAQASVSSNKIVFKADDLINFKTISSTIVLSGLTNDFVPTSISFYGTNIVGTVGFPQSPVFSMGTSSGANDLIVRCPVFTAQQGNFFTLSVDAIQDMSSGKSPVIPAGTNIYLNVTTPDSSATTNIQQMFISGYYIFE